jgi:ABC-type branched-subunit amino acid transport system ATPase component
MNPALETRGLCKNFGALAVARDIAFRLERGARHALIGPNGAGKTTFVNMVSGKLPPSSGAILLDGEDVTALAEAQRVKRGLARTFQITQLFRGLSVIDNVALAVGERRGVAGDLLRPAGSPRTVLEESYAVLERLGLADDALRPLRELAYGRQRLVEMAVALALEPKVLLLDEPAAGLSRAERQLLTALLLGLDREVTLLIIEHDMDVALTVAERVTMMYEGAVIVEGTPAEIRSNQRVHDLYLGRAHV